MYDDAYQEHCEYEANSHSDYMRERFGEYCKRHNVYYGGDCDLCEGEAREFENDPNYDPNEKIYRGHDAEKFNSDL